MGSVAIVASFVWMTLSIPPQISPQQLAADIRAQRVHRAAEDLTAKATTPREPASVSTIANASGNTRQAHAAPPGSSTVTFEMLSGFRFFVTDQLVDKASDPLTVSRNCLAQIPPDVRALDEKEVSVSGFMLPLKYEGRLTREFLLLRNQSLCCYGKPPAITEWVNVRMVGKPVKAVMDVPVTACGVFHVGAVTENGELLGIYSLDAQKIKGCRE